MSPALVLLIVVLSLMAAGAVWAVVVTMRDGYRAIPVDGERARAPRDREEAPAGRAVRSARSGLLRGIRIVPSRALALRLVRLVSGLILYGAGCALTVEAGLGVDPWTVLAEGLAHRTGIGVGWITNIVGALVLLLWIPLRQRLGVGTVLNVLVVGTSMQVVIDVVPAPVQWGLRVASLIGGILLVAVASAIYIGARLGAGPRDGLMTGLSARFGWPIWRSRATVEVTVLAAGLLLGGTAGWGTLAFALLIGPLVHIAMRVLRVRPARTAAPRNTLRPWVRSSPSARSTS